MSSLSKAVFNHISAWQKTQKGLSLSGRGEQALLDLPMTAFFASRQCPGTAIRAAMEWAMQQAQTKRVVVSGFHSPLEQSVLKVLMEARNPVVVVLARPVEGAKLAPEWAEPLAQGRMAVVSVATGDHRLTEALATQRNSVAANLATDIIVAHASPGGALDGLCEVWRAQGLRVDGLMRLIARAN